jgi:hypothetical protein
MQNLRTLNSSGWILKGIPEERYSSFFIRTLTNVEKEDDNCNYKLIFTRSLFFSCLLNYTVHSKWSIPNTPASNLTPSSPFGKN